MYNVNTFYGASTQTDGQQTDGPKDKNYIPLDILHMPKVL